MHAEAIDATRRMAWRSMWSARATASRSAPGLRGDFNVANILAAFATAVEGLGIAPKTAADGIAAPLPPSRAAWSPIDLGQPFTALVDFAHTPNALRRALEAARTMTRGRVIAVFGSAGLRDREKRRLMAEVAAQLADLTILTAEDPRTESLDAILAEMAAGADGRGRRRGPDLLAHPRSRPGDPASASRKPAPATW